MYLHTKNEVSRSTLSKVRAAQGRHTHMVTHRHKDETERITTDAFVGGKNSASWRVPLTYATVVA